MKISLAEVRLILENKENEPKPCLEEEDCLVNIYKKKMVKNMHESMNLLLMS